MLVSGYLLLQEAGHDAAVEALTRAQADLVAVETASWPLLEAFGVDRFFEETSVADAVLANEREVEVLTGRGGAARRRSANATDSRR